MKTFSISNIRNILIYGEYDAFHIEFHALTHEQNFNVHTVSNIGDFTKYLKSGMVHLLILDACIGYKKIKSIMKEITDYSMRNIPIILVVDQETLDEKYEYFDIGITHFYERGQVAYLIDLIQRVDREETYRKSFKDMSIAILDDDRLQLRILKSILNKNGVYDADVYSHPEELLKSTQTYDIYLVDLILPDIDGEIVMYELRKRYEHAVIIGVSSIEKQSTIAKVLAIGANDYLIKPVSASVFMAKLYNFAKNLMLRKENELKTKVLQELASKDGLTSLYNHRYIQELLTKMVKQAQRQGQPLSLMMLDIDDFKLLNDQYGHQYGDHVLSAVAKTLLNSVRESDLVGRYGGEEFMIVLPNTTPVQGMIIADRIKTEVSKLMLEHDISITISGGIAELETNVKQLIYDADCLLYEAKHTGKNKILNAYENINEINAYETC